MGRGGVKVVKVGVAKEGDMGEVGVEGEKGRGRR